MGDDGKPTGTPNQVAEEPNTGSIGVGKDSTPSAVVSLPLSEDDTKQIQVDVEGKQKEWVEFDDEEFGGFQYADIPSDGGSEGGDSGPGGYAMISQAPVSAEETPSWVDCPLDSIPTWDADDGFGDGEDGSAGDTGAIGLHAFSDAAMSSLADFQLQRLDDEYSSVLDRADSFLAKAAALGVGPGAPSGLGKAHADASLGNDIRNGDTCSEGERAGEGVLATPAASELRIMSDKRVPFSAESTSAARRKRQAKAKVATPAQSVSEDPPLASEAMLKDIDVDEIKRVMAQMTFRPRPNSMKDSTVERLIAAAKSRVTSTQIAPDGVPNQS